MNRHPLLCLTHDDALARRWALLGEPWHLTRIVRLEEASGEGALLVDAALPGLPPLEAARWQPLAHHHPLILASSHPNDAEGLGAINAGFSGYCHAYCALDHLRQVVSVVESGELWVGRSILSRLLRAVDTHKPAPDAPNWAHTLTPREQDVALKAAQGDSNADIAASLEISERTVKAHLSAIFDKLGIADRLQLALRVHGIR